MSGTRRDLFGDALEDQENIDQDHDKNASFPNRIRRHNHTWIRTAKNSEFELLHRVSESEKAKIMAALPGLGESIFRRDGEGTNKSYKIVLGTGTFSRARLARHTDEQGREIYYAVRKIKNILPVHAGSRNDVIEATKREAKLHEIVRSLNKQDDFALIELVAETKNKRNTDQLYQFMPLADFGDGKKFAEIFSISTLSDEEKIKLFTHMLSKLVKTISDLNQKGFYLRDIKPENILFTSHGDIWLSDLGSSVYYPQNGEKIFASNLSDCAYLPPNIIYDHVFNKNAGSQETEKRKDRYALGLTLLQLWYPEMQYYIDNFRRDGKNFKTIFQSIEKEECMFKYASIFDNIFNLPAIKAMPKNIRSLIKELLATDDRNAEFNAGILTKHHVSIDSKDLASQARLLFRKMLSPQTQTKGEETLISTMITRPDESCDGYVTNDLQTDEMRPSPMLFFKAAHHSVRLIDESTVLKPIIK